MTDPARAAGESDLGALLRGLRPDLRPGRFVFVTAPAMPAGAEPIAWIHEDEGLSLVLHQADADRLHLPYDFVSAMITLTVHSALDAVGLTAAVATALTEARISCNVVAGRFHDHLFVPVERADEALDRLSALSAASS